MKIKKIALRGLVALGLTTLATAPISYPRIKEIGPYLSADYNSEKTRHATRSSPTDGLKGNLISLEEHVKTARDLALFTVSDVFDKKPRYDLNVDKTENKMDVYLNSQLIKTMNIGSGEILKPDKTKFGEYVTPNGDYLLINNLDVNDLRRKFGRNADLYGEGLMQLSGPWAPYIAIHGTFDNAKIGARKSNGCINVTNEDLRWLMENVGMGTRVHVYESKSPVK